MNYVNEQNMKEILDGIARKIGTGGGSGAGLEDWQPSNAYKENDIFVYNGQIYKSIVDFESDTTFSVIKILEEYELQSGDVPIAYEKGKDITINDIVSYNGDYYKALYDFTCGEEFGLYAFEQYTPKELTTEQEDTIVQHWNDIIGDKIGMKIPVEVQAVRQTLFEGTFNTINSPLQLNDSIENYDQFELYFTNENIDEMGVYVYGTDVIDYTKKDAFRIYNGINTTFSYSVSSNFTDATHFKINSITVHGWSACYLVKIVGIKYINPNIYSTTEKVVGTWIDGKPLYQRTYEGTTPNNSSEGTVITLDNDVHCVELNGFIYTASGEYIVLGYANSSNTTDFILYYVNSSNQLRVKSVTSAYQNRPCIITIKYTKTTD